MPHTQKLETKRGDKLTRKGHEAQKRDLAPAALDDSHLCGGTGAAEQVQGKVRGNPVDRQDSSSQGQQETAQSLQADSAPGSSTGPDGPPSVSKGGKRGGSKSIASAPKRQMNFWQEEEKAQFLNAYRVSKKTRFLFFFILLVLSHVVYKGSNSPVPFSYFICCCINGKLRQSVPSPVIPTPSHAASSACSEPKETHPICHPQHSLSCLPYKQKAKCKHRRNAAAHAQAGACCVLYIFLLAFDPQLGNADDNHGDLL